MFTKGTRNYSVNHNYNKIFESDWFLARPIFDQIGARVAKVSNDKVPNHKVRVLHMRMRALYFKDFRRLSSAARMTGRNFLLQKLRSRFLAVNIGTLRRNIAFVSL